MLRGFFSAPILLCALLSCSVLTAPAGAAEEKTWIYDTGLPQELPPLSRKPAKVEKRAAKAFAEAPEEPTEDSVRTVRASGKVPKPRRKPFGPGGLFPRVLKANDVAAYRKAFAATKRGDWQAADSALSSVSNGLLKGHVLAARYRSAGYNSHYTEIENWMRQYADHPDARRLARIGRDKGAYNMPEPTGSDQPLVIQGIEKKRTYPGRNSDAKRALLRRIRQDLIEDRYYAADQRLAYEAQGLLDFTETGIQEARIAGEIYYDGNCREAVPRLQRTLSSHGDKAALASWFLGLCQWRAKNYRSARDHFRRYARAPYTSDWERAAGHFWAARSQQRLTDEGDAKSDFQAAAKLHFTFYGLLARIRLGQDTRSDVSDHFPKKADVERIMSWKAGKRAFALYQVGELRRAELELVSIARKREEALRNSLLRIAGAAGLPDLANRLAHYKTARDSKYDYAGLYPIPAYRPDGGFTIDRALVYGIMRKESFFNPRLVSSADARGLLQVYPPSARWMERKGMVKPWTPSDLLIPGRNLQIGQRYLKYLLKEHPAVKNDIVRFVIGYNAGPNRIKKWEARADHGGDPLLFIESIPSRETRSYAERTLSYIWRYRDRMGQPLDEAEDLANARWPQVRRFD